MKRIATIFGDEKDMSLITKDAYNCLLEFERAISGHIARDSGKDIEVELSSTSYYKVFARLKLLRKNEINGAWFEVQLYRSSCAVYVRLSDNERASLTLTVKLAAIKKGETTLRRELKSLYVRATSDHLTSCLLGKNTGKTNGLDLEILGAESQIWG